MIPKDWDENGRIIAVQIATPGEDNYALDLKEIKGQELFDHLQQEIEVSGELISNGKESSTIRVKEYKIFEKDDLKNIEKKVQNFLQKKEE